MSCNWCLFVLKFLWGETLFPCRGCGQSSICVSFFGKKSTKVRFPSCSTKLLDSERRGFHWWDQVHFAAIPISSVWLISFWLSWKERFYINSFVRGLRVCLLRRLLLPACCSNEDWLMRYLVMLRLTLWFYIFMIVCCDLFASSCHKQF